MKTLRNVSWPSIASAAVLMAMVHAVPAKAEVTAHADDSVPDRPVVILEIKLVDSGDPIESVAADGEVVELLTDGGDPVPSLSTRVWQRHLGAGAAHRTLNEHGLERGDERPAIVIGAERVPVAVWARASAAGYDLVASRFVAGEWSAPTVVSTNPGHDLGASLAVDSAGGLHLAYWVSDHGGARVEYRRAGPDGTAWSEPTVVSLPGEVAVRPSIALSGDHPLIAYELHVSGLGSTPRQIIVAERIAGEWRGEVVAETRHGAPNRPGIHAIHGRVWIEWIDRTDEMRWTRREADERWAPREVEPFDGLEDRDYHVRGRIKAAVCSR